jgi:hypothetical protein
MNLADGTPIEVETKHDLFEPTVYLAVDFRSWGADKGC